MFFKCKHPFKALYVQKEQTEKYEDEDFMLVNYHFFCSLCHEQLTHKHVRLIGGVEAFLSKGNIKCSLPKKKDDS